MVNPNNYDVKIIDMGRTYTKNNTVNESGTLLFLMDERLQIGT